MRTLTSWHRVKCITCISFSSCRPAPISQPFGCGQWVGQGEDGNLYRAPDYSTIEKDDDGAIVVTLPLPPKEGITMFDAPITLTAEDKLMIQHRRENPEGGGGEEHAVEEEVDR